MRLCPEWLFQPTMMGKYEEGVQTHLNDSIMACESDIRKELYKNIVLAGGSTMFEGLRERMKSEISSLALSNVTVEVDAPADRSRSSWLGGQIISQIDKFENLWITRKQYEDSGARIVHQKCF